MRIKKPREKRRFPIGQGVKAQDPEARMTVLGPYGEENDSVLAWSWDDGALRAKFTRDLVTIDAEEDGSRERSIFIGTTSDFAILDASSPKGIDGIAHAIEDAGIRMTWADRPDLQDFRRPQDIAYVQETARCETYGTDDPGERTEPQADRRTEENATAERILAWKKAGFPPEAAGWFERRFGIPEGMERYLEGFDGCRRVRGILAAANAATAWFSDAVEADECCRTRCGCGACGLLPFIAEIETFDIEAWPYRDATMVAAATAILVRLGERARDARA